MQNTNRSQITIYLLMISLINKNLQAKQFKQLIFLSLLLIPWVFAKSQVTIGALQKPEKGMLLQLKTKEPQAGDNTTTDDKGRGLGLPRVELINT